MTEATNTKMMDTEAGGEQTQYEGQSTFVNPHASQSGQFGDPSSTLKTPAEKTPSVTKERGEKKAENIRYGEAISEHGFGGETVGNKGEANEGGSYGRVGEDNGVGETPGKKQMRREQGYGGGSGVGA